MILFDRIEVLKKTFNKYGIDNFCLSFSGGKDSTILHYMIDEAVPENNIPRVYIDTGIEYDLIRKFVYELSKNDDRFIIIKPDYPLGKTLKNFGYPFKSKQHSEMVYLFQNSGTTKSVDRYINPSEERKRFGCPKKLMYQFDNDTDLFKISSYCCTKLKKEPFAKWQKTNSKPIKITGERVSEGGLRAIHGDCLQLDKKGNLKKFKPLNKVDNDFADWYIEKRNIDLCELYKEPYNFKRTGCVGCPYNTKIQSDVDTLYKLLPDEYRKVKLLWKPVYDEYIRLRYRLKHYPDKDN